MDDYASTASTGSASASASQSLVSKLVCLALAAVSVWVATQQVDEGIQVLAHHRIGAVSLASGIIHYVLAGLLVTYAQYHDASGCSLVFCVLVVIVLNVANYKNHFSQQVLSLWLGLALSGLVFVISSYRKELY
jgi:hypothetical protein